jgi:hypothetical protein
MSSQTSYSEDHKFLDDILEVGYLQATQIIRSRSPVGKFWAQYGFVILAVNNTTGAAWIEYFESVEDAEKWLRFPWTDPLHLKPGDWVIYTNGARKEIGVVKRLNESRGSECIGCPSYFVWYHEGDTASCTPSSTLQSIDHPKRFESLVNNAYAIPSLIEKRKEILK